jgi:hypothetical protein
VSVVLMVSGSRDYGDAVVFDKIMTRAMLYLGLSPSEITELVHGACSGVDSLADMWAPRVLGIDATRLCAHDFGKWPACGPKRNAAMVERATHAIFLPDCRGVDDDGKPVGKGTKDAMTKWCRTDKPFYVQPVKP